MSIISVIIPIYNVEKYIEQCLKSIINNTFKDIEIICVDDCGTDKSMGIAEEYAKKDKRIKIIHHDKNKGSGVARNTGIAEASGEYIFFLDSDDYILPDTLEKVYDNISKTNADVVVIKPEAFADNNSDDIINRTVDMNRWINDFEVGNYTISKENFISIIHKIPVIPWGKLYNKEFLLNHNLKFIEHNVIHEDEGFWIKICSCFPRINYINDVGVMYRIRQSSITAEITQKKRICDFRKNIKDSFDYIKKYRKEYAGLLIKQIKKDKWYDSIMNHPVKNLLQNIFSIKNEYKQGIKYKVITIFGVKFRKKQNYKECTMNIFFASDEKFAKHLCTSITSILVNSNEMDYHNFYILDDNISEKSKINIIKLKKIKNFNIEFIKVDNDLFKDCPQIEICKQITKQTYYRYIIPMIKPELEKVLYLDCDIIVKKSLAELYNMDLQNSYCGVVQEMNQCSSEDAKRLNIKNEFNAGVILINNKKWKEEGLTQVFFENTTKLHKQGLLLWQDQDVLNYTFKDNVKWVSPKFNYQQNAASEPYYSVYTEEEVKHANRNVVIIHYNNQNKPWLLKTDFFPFDYYYILFIAGYHKEALSLASKCFNKYKLKPFLQNIFSIKNTKDRKHKVITFLGIKAKIYREKYIEEIADKNFVNNLQRFSEIKTSLYDVDKTEFKKRMIIFKYDYLYCHNKYSVNLGDYVQTLATQNVIQKIYPNIDYIYWDMDNLLNYTGMPASAVMQGWFSHGSAYLPNEKILPVYVGTHITTQKRKEFLYFSKKNPKYFKQLTFGCRDTSTLKFMRENGFSSYLSRCLTLTFPKREINKEYDKIFIVNISDKYLKHIPEKILKKAEFVNQKAVDIGKPVSDYADYEKYMAQTQELLNKYRDNASLIITDALHCASPCIAMGIPTVLIDFEDKNDRFGSLDGIIKIYNKQDLINGNIDFNPTPPNIEDLKQLMIKNVELSIKEAFDEDIDIQELNNIRKQIESYNLQK